MTQFQEPRKAALWFAAQGYPVFPVHSVVDGACTCGSSTCTNVSKHPYFPFAPNGFKNATCDIDTITSWFDQCYWLNYGIATDDLLVVDVDTKHGGMETWEAMWRQPSRAVPHTWQARTGSGGLHLMFKNTPKVRCGDLDKGIQIKARGGYVVGVACKHKSGGTYGWLPQCSPDEAPLADAPDWLLAVLKSRTYLGKPTKPDEWRKLAGTRLYDGERNTAMLRLAGHLIANPLNDPLEIRELLIGWDLGMCEPPLGIKRVAEIVETLCVSEQEKEKWI